MDILEYERKEYQGGDPLQTVMEELCHRFQCKGDIVNIRQVPGGRINRSYEVALYDGTNRNCYLFQQINTAVFPKPIRMMQNIMAVTTALERKYPQRDERQRLNYRTTEDGNSIVQREDGSFWRCCRFIEGARTVESGEASEKELFMVGRAFGEFSVGLTELSVEELAESIPHFHDIKSRWEQFWKAVHSDVWGRKKGMEKEIGCLQSVAIMENVKQYDREKQTLPRRIIHGDTKGSNVLIDSHTGEILTVIDLDTCMPGYLMQDFGDMVRSMAGKEIDGKMQLDMVALRALTQGFGVAWKSDMIEAEKETLADGIGAITLELALRYLTDYLQGDLYFSGGQPGDNLQRGRRWLALYCDILEKMPTIRQIIHEGLS